MPLRTKGQKARNTALSYTVCVVCDPHVMCKLVWSVTPQPSQVALIFSRFYNKGMPLITMHDTIFA